MQRILILSALLLLHAQPVVAKNYDLVIAGGRVIDPETGLDAVRNVGVSNGEILKISKRSLDGETVVDASGLIVAPGFIDRNTYTLGSDLFRIRVADGVTTTFNFEEGAFDVPAAYAAMEGKALINYGFSSSWGAARTQAAMQAPVEVKDGVAVTYPSEEISNRALSDDELTEMLALIEEGLKAGAPAVGVGVEYAPGATNSEILAVFRLAAEYNRSVQIHMRAWNKTTDHQDMYEVIAGAAITGASIHISHLNSSGDEYTPRYLGFIEEANRRGLSVSTECYPYAAWMTDIRAPFLSDWREWPDEAFSRFEWPETGERLTRETFERYREKGGFVIGHVSNDAWVNACVEHPETFIASDGGWDGGKTHPRVAGSNARFLGEYVREKGVFTLSRAIRKLALAPAMSLEQAAPQMSKKGRLQEGMDADIVIFNAETVIDQATYKEPVLPSRGIETVIVGGTVIYHAGEFRENSYPGAAIRLAPLD
ncbi:MAG: amidohydrolase family protein [Pseudomonadota bacterium]